MSYPMYLNSLVPSSRRLPIERVTEGRPVIDTNHAQVHAQNAYAFYHKFTLAGTGGGASAIIRMDVPEDAYIHFQASNIENDGTLDIELTLIRDPEITVAGTLGTAIIPRNRHHGGGSSSGANDASVLSFAPYSGLPTFTGGDIVDGWYFPKEGSVNQKVGGTKENSIEIVLRPDTTYFWKFTTTQTTGTGHIVFRPFWYEDAGF